MEMSDYEKIFYAQVLGFNLRRYYDGEWYLENSYDAAKAAINPNSTRFADFYTEVRFVHHPDEAPDEPTTVIFVYPNEDRLQLILNAINWEVESAGIDLEKLGLSYPITVDDLIVNYEEIDRLIRLDGHFMVLLQMFSNEDYYLNMDNLCINFELTRLSEYKRGENTQTVLDILDQPGMSEDEARPIIRAAGSFDGFVAVADLMLSDDLSAEAALKQYAKG